MKLCAAKSPVTYPRMTVSGALPPQAFVYYEADITADQVYGDNDFDIVASSPDPIFAQYLYDERLVLCLSLAQLCPLR